MLGFGNETSECWDLGMRPGSVGIWERDLGVLGFGNETWECWDLGMRPGSVGIWE